MNFNIDLTVINREKSQKLSKIPKINNKSFIKEYIKNKKIIVKKIFPKKISLKFLILVLNQINRKKN